MDQEENAEFPHPLKNKIVALLVVREGLHRLNYQEADSVAVFIQNYIFFLTDVTPIMVILQWENIIAPKEETKSLYLLVPEKC